MLLKFRTGAFAAGLPVQPVAIIYPPTAGWVQSLAGNMLHVFGRACLPIRVVLLPVHQPTAAERADPQLFASNVQDAIAANVVAKRQADRAKNE